MNEFKPELEYIINDEGYPTPAYLESISSWPLDSGYNNLMEYVEKGWHWDNMIKHNYLHDHHQSLEHKILADIWSLSTGGWSGNEDIIEALHDNALFYMMCWYSSQKGGHYKYEIKRKKDGTEN